MDMLHSEHELQAPVPLGRGSDTSSLNEASAAHDIVGKRATTAAGASEVKDSGPSAPPIGNTISQPNSSPSSPPTTSPSLPTGVQEQPTPQHNADDTPNRSQHDEEAVRTTATPAQEHDNALSGTTEAGTRQNRCRNLFQCLCHWRACSAVWLVLITLIVVFILPIYIKPKSSSGGTDQAQHNTMAQEYLRDHHSVFVLNKEMRNTGLLPNPKKFYDYSKGVEVPDRDRQDSQLYQVICPLPPGVFDWVQQGDELEGVNANVSGYGHAVDMLDDGTVLAVAARDTRKESVFVDVYELGKQSWQNWAHLEPPDGTIYPDTGIEPHTVALSGNGEVVAFVHVNVLIVYRKSSETGNWLQWGASYTEDRYHFGLSLALNEFGTILAVLGSDGTHAFICLLQNEDLSNGLTNTPDEDFTRSAWKKMAPDLRTSLVISVNDTGHVAMNSQGTRVAVTTGRGPFKVFDLLNERLWEQVGSFPIASSYGSVTRSLDMSADGGTLAIGRADGDSDRVVVLQFTSMDSEWKLKGQPFLDASLSRRFGESVWLNHDGSILAVGSPGGRYRIGTVLVYQYNEDCCEWFPISRSGRGNDLDYSSMRRTSPGLQDTFGQSLAMNKLGNRIVSGAPGARIDYDLNLDYDMNPNRGVAVVHELWLQY